MRIQVGLRAEIILQITLLVAAALLLGGVLLLKFTERELLAQAVENSTEIAAVLAATLSASPDVAERLLGPLKSAGALQGWAMIERGGGILQSSGEFGPPAMDSLRSALFMDEKFVRVAYASPDLFGRTSPSHVQLILPLEGRGSVALQLRFSLDSVHQRVLGAYRILLIYVVLYGAVFIFFGTVLLNRAVIRPVRILQRSTQKVAAGELAHALPEEGPREVAELARDFNAMVEALRTSRGETETTIKTLEETILQLRRTRDDLLHAERMASVGHLAAGMAHEVGNPLGALIGYLGILRDELPPGPNEEIAGRALAEAERIDRLVRELLDYAAPKKGEADLLDPAAVAGEAIEMLLHQGNLSGLTVERHLAPLPPVRISRHRLLQVLVNLILNSRDAVGQGGKVVLSGGVSNDDVFLAVSDNGKGIDPESLAHIFDPFYTTKAPGKGRGLGLSVCHSIITEAGGRIEVDSRPEEGSVFTVLLPRGAEANAPHESSPPPGSGGGRGVVEIKIK